MASGSKVDTVESRPPIGGHAAVLLGVFIAQQRMKRFIPRDGLVSGLKTEEWLESVERGDIELNDPLLRQVEALFKNSTNARVPVRTVARILRDRPYGATARRLGAFVDSRGSGFGTKTSESGSPVPRGPLEAIANRDQFLVLSPILLFGALVTLIAQTLRLALGSADGRWLIQLIDGVGKAALPLVGVATIISAIALPETERALGRFAARRRSSEVNEDIQLCVSMLAAIDQKAAAESFSWRIDGFVHFMIPHHRDRAVTSTLRVAFIERVEATVLLSTVVAGVAVLVAIGSDTLRLHDGATIALFISLIWIELRIRRTAAKATGQALAALSLALGELEPC